MWPASTLDCPSPLCRYFLYSVEINYSFKCKQIYVMWYVSICLYSQCNIRDFLEKLENNFQHGNKRFSFPTASELDSNCRSQGRWVRKTFTNIANIVFFFSIEMKFSTSINSVLELFWYLDHLQFLSSSTTFFNLRKDQSLSSSQGWETLPLTMGLNGNLHVHISSYWTLNTHTDFILVLGDIGTLPWKWILKYFYFNWFFYRYLFNRYISLLVIAKI